MLGSESYDFLAQDGVHSEQFNAREQLFKQEMFKVNLLDEYDKFRANGFVLQRDLLY